MIDAQVNPTKPSPNAATVVPASPFVEPDENTQPCGTCSDEECNDIQMKYHIDANVLGEGHHGSVRQCIDRSTGKHYAVKTICKSAPSVDVRGIQREVSLLESLKHGRIVQLEDVFEDSEYVHLITELCFGGELFDRIVSCEGCFSEQEAARILYQLLDSVSYLHKMGVVHRDIKPENILFETNEEDSDIKLIDFGLARKHNSREKPMSTIVGTPYYLAPEVLAKSYDKACDLWSIGVIAYILLCGYPPFNGADNKEVYASVKRGVYYFPSAEWQHVSHAAKDFVMRLLQTDPRKRMTAEQALSHPWIVHHRNLTSLSSSKAAEHREATPIVDDDAENISSFKVRLNGPVPHKESRQEHNTVAYHSPSSQHRNVSPRLSSFYR
jgi:serine/threonine protein kinase